MTAIMSFSLLLPLLMQSGVERVCGVSGGVATLSRCGFRSGRYLEVKMYWVRDRDQCPLSGV